MTSPPLSSLAVVIEKPERLSVSRLGLAEPAEADCVVDIEWSGISTGTERLLWTGRMPEFPGLGYPLVPGYESVGVIRQAGRLSGRHVGERVFVPGASCYLDARGLFGGASSRVVTAGARVLLCPAQSASDDADAVLLALAATAWHVTAPGKMASEQGAPVRRPQPELIIGHGVLGRLLARIAVAAGAAPVVWEANPARWDGAAGYTVCDPASDPRRDYRVIADCSGDVRILDQLVQRLAPGGEIILAGFYEAPVQFAFPPAFMREAIFRISAEWKSADLIAVAAEVQAGRLSLDGLLTHRRPAGEALAAYETAFSDPSCLKMVLDWRQLS